MLAAFADDDEGGVLFELKDGIDQSAMALGGEDFPCIAEAGNAELFDGIVQDRIAA